MGVYNHKAYRNYSGGFPVFLLGGEAQASNCSIDEYDHNGSIHGPVANNDTAEI